MSIPAADPPGPPLTPRESPPVHPLLTADTVTEFQTKGVTVVRGLLAGHVDAIRDGIARNMAEPGPYAAENLKPGDAGRFFGDYCNDARYVDRPGPTSPPFPGHGMRPGDRLREDWFPVVFRRA